MRLFSLGIFTSRHQQTFTVWFSSFLSVHFQGFKIGIALCLIVLDYKVAMIGDGLMVQSSGLGPHSKSMIHEITLKLECSFSDAIPRNKADAAPGPRHTKQPVSKNHLVLIPSVVKNNMRRDHFIG